MLGDDLARTRQVLYYGPCLVERNATGKYAGCTDAIIYRLPVTENMHTPLYTDAHRERGTVCSLRRPGVSIRNLTEAPSMKILHRFRMLTHQGQIRVLIQIAGIAMLCIIVAGSML